MSKKPVPFKLFLAALRQVETGAAPNNGLGATGDGGYSYGPYQIQTPYAYDALSHRRVGLAHLFFETPLGETQPAPNLPNPTLIHKLLYHSGFGELVIYAYMQRYAPVSLSRMLLDDCIRMARIHNGGPSGHKKAATKPYSMKFIDALHTELSTQSWWWETEDTPCA